MVIDSHRHFWHYTDAEFGWIADDCLRRDFLPMDCGGMDSCVAVEARQCVEETNWLLDLADKHDFIKGVVGWLPIAADDFAETLESFFAAKNAEDAKLVGLRHVVQDEPDDGFILRPDFVRGVKTLLTKGLAYDILVFERHLPNVLKFVDALPADARLVLDHFGKPRDFAPWKRLVGELAQRENVYCKLSGLVTEIGVTADPRPYLETALEAFGPARLMFGSDWPVVTAHMEYAEWRGVVDSFTARLSQGEHDALMGGNARRFYKL
ncbi:MAG: amidohydrolase family protein [Kiritimatiellae bacterium]|nr:amidohydrolase family protein [Kiritimatiellia bacterium]